MRQPVPRPRKGAGPGTIMEHTERMADFGWGIVVGIAITLLELWAIMEPLTP